MPTRAQKGALSFAFIHFVFFGLLHYNKTKLQTTELLKQWSEQTTKKLPNKGSQTVHNTCKITDKLNCTENCEIYENSVETILLLQPLVLTGN